MSEASTSKDLSPERAPVLVIAGPTAAGKTAAAIHIAHLYKARLVSADAMQVYRGMDIGTGKIPSFVQKRFPHDCLDLREVGEPWCAQDFAEHADRAVDQAQRVIIVGGTVLYLRAFLYGLVPAPSANETLRAELERLDEPHAELARVDPVLAVRLHPNDRVRIIRGLEVYRLTGQRLSELHKQDDHRLRHAARVFFLDRQDLHERIDLRVDRMMERGYLDEVRRLLAAGARPEMKPMQSLGYKHLTAHLVEGLPLEEAVRRTKQDTWTFARKQRTWSRQHPDWVRLDARDRQGLLKEVALVW